ncbi:hypothetical protein DFP74_1260 [Nocardiopsis sp. Huas11]|uniref:hypothetical protein n=1 Tax=Nocardiopsis sp. Huas11 TaxID=2183912 RepID=UPI000EB18A3B|nr:hypothetical protein [Nocardiopsis sp. Huas11]RKS05655.1 hypothetical protein DFP74_1260 [Nocardiopsis sp. Huas11]
MRGYVRLVLGDVRERVRVPAYLVALLATVGLGYLAVPAVDAHWTVVDVAGYRGVYDSAYVGMATALASAVWLTLAGFYVVRDTIGRDRSTGVGELLAATRLGTPGYLLAKFGGNLAVLVSMLGVVAATAVVMQLVRGESTAVDPVALLTPYVVLALPLMVLTAAAAVLFEATPLLRGGLGNVAWTVVALALMIGGMSARAPFGGLGIGNVNESFRASMAAQGIDTAAGEFSLGLTYVDEPLRAFDWSGWAPSGDLVASRLLIVGGALVLALLPVLWFDRFDPSRRSGAAQASAAPRPVPEPVAASSGPRPRAWRDLPRTAAPPTPGSAWAVFPRLVAGELRMLLSGLGPWWWAVAAAVTVAALALPAASAPTVLLVAWVWPLLVWSRLGSRSRLLGLDDLLGSYPSPAGRFLAEWTAGVLLTAATGAGPLLRMLTAGDSAGAVAWAAGVLFIPSLAFALGTVSRVGRPFQALYPLLWYLVLNGLAPVDFLGAVRVDGRPAGPDPLLVGAVALGLLAVAGAVAAVRSRPPRPLRSARPA